MNFSFKYIASQMFTNHYKNKIYVAIRYVSHNKFLLQNFFTYKLFKKPRNQYKIKMLVVQNKDYVWVSLHCIISFLRFNPGSTIEVTVDETTVHLAKRIYKCIDRKRISLIFEKNNNLPPLWKKAELIVSMQGTEFIFMDADLRWHKALPKLPIYGVTVLSKEFDLLENSNYKKMIKANNWKHSKSLYMLNTSFIYLNKNSFVYSFKTVLNLLKNFEAVFNDSFGFTTKENVIRLSEQIVLSYLLQAATVSGLDDLINNSDKIGVESTYFGATGLRFGR
jgi:hypothetical protein